MPQQVSFVTPEGLKRIQEKLDRLRTVDHHPVGHVPILHGGVHLIERHIVPCVSWVGPP